MRCYVVTFFCAGSNLDFGVPERLFLGREEDGGSASDIRM